MIRSLLLVCILVPVTVAAADITVYVSPDGNDQRRGTVAVFDAKSADGPVATLVRARDLVREARKVGNGPRATIALRAGTYFLDAPLALDGTDSGLPDMPTVITGVNGERPTLTGTKRITKYSAFKGAILAADLDPGLFNGRRIHQLFINGEKQTLARYPSVDRQHPISGGWAYADGELVSNQRNRSNDSKRLLAIKAADLRNWSSADGAEVVVFPRYNWINDVIPVEVFDERGSSFRLKWDASYDIRPGDRYFVQNIFAELDSPGEWFFDPRQTRLYFWPSKSLSDKAEISVSNLETLFNITNAKHVEIRGLNIDATEGTAIKLIDASNCVVAANTIRNVGLKGRGTYAISVVGGAGNRITGNDIANTGGAGILLRGGDAVSLIASGHVAENNYIHHTGEVYKHGVAIELAGVGNVVRHNLIHDLPRMAILVGGNDHLIEFNRIHHTSLETIDSGAIYTSGRDWLSPRGVVIRYNEILDTVGFGFEFDKRRWTTHHFTFGIYLDDNSSGVDIVGNVIGRASWSGIFVRSGSYNRIVNNIIFDSAVNQIFYQGFGEGDPFRKLAREKHAEYSKYPAWAKYRGFADTSPDVTKSASNIWFLRNLVVYSGGTSKYAAMHRFDVESSRVTGNAILSRADEISIDDGSSAGLSWNGWRKLGLDSGSIIADSGAVPGADNWPAFNSSALARRIGFQPIPFEKIGPYRSVDRATWPIVEAESIRETLH